MITREEATARWRGVLLLVPLESRDRAARVFDVVTQTLRRWLATQFIAMVVVGLVTTTMLLILGVKSAIPLGILAGVFEFIPNVGPMLSAIPGVLLAFAESPQQGLIVALAYWGIQFLENNLLIVRGAVPGAPSGYVLIRKAVAAKRIKVAQVEKPKGKK